MKKYFENPEIELTQFAVDDIVTASGGFESSSGGDIDFDL